MPLAVVMCALIGSLAYVVMQYIICLMNKPLMV